MASAPPFGVNLTLGAYQVGVLASYVLFGVLTTQAYVYFTRFASDSAKLKGLVAFVWLSEVGHAGCIGSALYTYTIIGYGNPETLVRAPTTLLVAVFFSGLTASCGMPSLNRLPVQGFFSFRIYSLSKQLTIPCICWKLAALQFIGSTVVATTGLRMVTLTDFEAQWGWLLTTVWSVRVANDLIIAGTLVLLFLSQRKNIHQRTIPLVNKLIKWTIETGILTSAAGIIILACFVTMKKNYVFLAVFVIGSRLFSNSLLASLNSRVALRQLNEVTLPYLSPTVDLTTPNLVQVSQVITITNDSGESKSHNVESRLPCV